MTTSEARDSARAYQPTPAQLERANALKRFNRWAIYLPVAIASLIVLTLFVLLIWLAVVKSDFRAITSATADILTILAILPLFVFTLIAPGVAIYVVIESRRRSITPIQSLQRLLWRLESLLLKIQAFVNRLAPQVVRPVISFNSWLARLQTLLNTLITPNSARSMLYERNQPRQLEE